jgi:hypothetical protein
MKTQIPNIDPVYAVGGAVALAMVIFNGPQALRDMSANRAAVSAIIQANQAVERQAKLDTGSAERQNEIAVSRYKAGCQMVFTRDRRSFVALQNGQPILDPVTNAPMPPGGTFCDGIGYTGIVGPDGKITSIAFASDRQVIADAVKRYTTWNSQPNYNAPAQ